MAKESMKAFEKSKLDKSIDKATGYKEDSKADKKLDKAVLKGINSKKKK